MSLYIELLLSCLVSGLLVSKLAKFKGRDPVVWFWIGFVLNIAAIALVLLSKSFTQRAGVSHAR